jgi:Mn2+/Fe2+ NRAMP family transporter
MQASLVALVAALAGIILERVGSGTAYLMIIGDALIMGAFIIAITAFLLFLKDQVFGGGDQIAWTSR